MSILDLDLNDEAQKLHNKAIDEKRNLEFLNTSEKIRKAKNNKSRDSMCCEVEKFARGIEFNIIYWIVQIKTYLGISSLKQKAYVKYMLSKIAHLYFKEAVVYKSGTISTLGKSWWCSASRIWRLPDFTSCRIRARLESLLLII